MKHFKLERISKLLNQEVNMLIVLGKIKDPRISQRATILHSSISKDLTSATLYVSSLQSDSKLELTVEALNHAKGFIQKQIAQKFNWKNTPKLYFKCSQGLKNEFRVVESLNRINTSKSIQDTSEHCSGSSQNLNSH